ncbi:MAG TPA: thioredoxin domain-containing protein [Gemmatimonadales bacterium]
MTVPNRLAQATSPYLLQHAGNPVDWYEWGEEALARARAEDRPILLSIGYSACHWCHVMAHESFENPATAELMNRHFVNIKVDREERPDLDEIYMAATVAMNQGQGGWPMTVFLAPDQRPFFAGTYYPPEDRFGRPGFPALLRRIAELWNTDRTRLLEQGERLVEYLQMVARPQPGPAIGETELRQVLDQYNRAFDTLWGGFGRAPKFPPSASLMLLLRLGRRFADPWSGAMVRRTLEAMAAGGIYDQIGGGFCRYSTDERWLVPHFEKMLYDNALLARAYLEGWQATGTADWRRIAVEVLDYVLREMTDPAGGFWSATDADSEGEEGKFFVWTPEEVVAELPPQDAELACAWWDITSEGNWEGKNIPNLPQPLEAFAASRGLEAAAVRERLDRAREVLYRARARRVPPGLDDKVLAGWNGLMISALAEGYRALRDRRYLEAATRAAEFVIGNLTAPGGRLHRSWRRGTTRGAGVLEDYAWLGNGLLDLYEAGGAWHWFEAAERLASIVRTGFAAPGGGFFATSDGHEALVVRFREGSDGATPSANAEAARLLARLGYHRGDAAMLDEAAGALAAWAGALRQAPRAFASSLLVADFLLDGPVELALVGQATDPGTEALWAALGQRFIPRRIVAHGMAGTAGPPLLEGKSPVGGAASLYVCRNFSCEAPITDPARIAL